MTRRLLPARVWAVRQLAGAADLAAAIAAGTRLLTDYGELHLALKRPAEAIPYFEQALLRGYRTAGQGGRPA